MCSPFLCNGWPSQFWIDVFIWIWIKSLCWSGVTWYQFSDSSSSLLCGRQLLDLGYHEVAKYLKLVFYFLDILLTCTCSASIFEFLRFHCVKLNVPMVVIYTYVPLVYTWLRSVYKIVKPFEHFLHTFNLFFCKRNLPLLKWIFF